MSCPVASTCPKCGSREFKRVRAEGWITFKDDRKCTACGTRYTPPIPAWAACVFIVLGTLVTGFGIVLDILPFVAPSTTLAQLGDLMVFCLAKPIFLILIPGGSGGCLNVVLGIIVIVFGSKCISYAIHYMVRSLGRQDKPSNFTIGQFRPFPE
jgi:hypothetical protein